MVRFQPLAERHYPREVDLVHRQVEVHEGGGFGQELGKRDRACRGELCRGEKEPFERRVERKRRAQRLDLTLSQPGDQLAERGVEKEDDDVRRREQAPNKGFG